MRQKAKTHRGAAKRFKVTARGKFLRWSSSKSHLLGKKSPAQKRRLSSTKTIEDADKKRVQRLLPNR